MTTTHSAVAAESAGKPPTKNAHLVAWVEESPQGLDAHGTAMVAQLDGAARVVGVPLPIPLADVGNPTALALAPDGDGVRAFLARSNHEDVTLDGVMLRADGSAATPAWRLLDLDAPGSFDVALAVSGDAIFFDDIGATAAAHRVRRAAITWRH